MGGGYSGVNFGHPKSEVFWNGGYSGVNFGHPKSEVFRNGGEGGYSGLQFQKGVNWRIWTKIYCSARNLLVHHSSLSHTTYVETNKNKQLLLTFIIIKTRKSYLWERTTRVSKNAQQIYREMTSRRLTFACRQEKMTSLIPFLQRGTKPGYVCLSVVMRLLI